MIQNSFISSFIYSIVQDMEAEWQFPAKKQFPLSISFDPKMVDLSQSFMNPFLGYPNCPIIGRYNRGEYKIEYKCKFNENKQQYECGNKRIFLPEVVHYNIRNIPEFIINNKPPNLKNVPDILPQKYPVTQDLSIIWIVSFGELGKDFLNYLNHMYILACTLFMEERLQRQVHYLPIYAYLPEDSGLHTEEVQKGLAFGQFRGEYMSFHLNKGAPAFSPNNMRLAVAGGKIITTQPPAKSNKKGKTKYIQKQKVEQFKQKTQQKQIKAKEQPYLVNFSQLQAQAPQNSNQYLNKKQVQPKQVLKGKNNGKNNQGFVHFYSSVLLEKDYRVYYHWHIDDHYKQDMIKQILRTSTTFEEFLENYNSVLGSDPLTTELSRLLFP